MEEIRDGYELWKKWGGEQKRDQVKLGPHISYELISSRRQVLFMAARYKFAMKMIGNIYEPDTKKILDLGCSDGFGTHFVAEYANYVLGVDFDEDAIKNAQKNQCDDRIEFLCDDFINPGSYHGNAEPGKYGAFDGIVSFDVIEHIYPENEGKFMQNVLKNLKSDGTLVLGTPSQENQQYSQECVRNSHINVYTGERLYEMVKRYFKHVYLFTQNDEIIHTGHLRMANYLIVVCSGKRNEEGNENGIY